MGNRLHNNDRDQEASQDENYSDGVEMGQRFVEKANHETGQPCYDEKSDKDIPWLSNKVWMRNTPHLDDSVGYHGQGSVEIITF
jgi:hypothetical protein